MHILSTLTYLLCQLEKKVTMRHEAQGRGRLYAQKGAQQTDGDGPPPGTGTSECTLPPQSPLGFLLQTLPQSWE